MPRSSPQPSSIVARIRRSDAEAGPSGAEHHPTRGRRWKVRFASLMRWLHIYISMFSLAAVLFFSVTGITLNHPDWFFGETSRDVQAEGRLDTRWLKTSGEGDNSDPEHTVARLEIVEHLRATHGIRGALSEFRADDRECTVSFKGPGYSADAFINRDTGTYNLTESRHGFIAVINDFHKGRDTGKAWSVVIDVSAILMTIVSLTGLVLLFYLKRKRVSGVLTGIVGLVVVAAIAWFWCP